MTSEVFVKGPNLSRASFKAKHKSENQNSGILLLFLSMQKRRHYLFLFPYLSLYLLYPLKQKCFVLANWYPDNE